MVRRHTVGQHTVGQHTVGQLTVGHSADVVFVLLCLQAGLGLLGMVGLMLLMGSPLHAVGSVLKAGALLWLAAKVVRGRTWALVATMVVEWAGLVGVWLGALLGLLPGLTPAMTVTGLLTGVGLPVAIGWLCALQLATARRGTRVEPPTVPLPVLVSR